MEIKEEQSSFSEENGHRQQSPSSSYEPHSSNQSRKRHYSNDSQSDWSHASPSEETKHATYKRHKSDKHSLSSRGSTSSMLTQFIGLIGKMNDPNEQLPFENLLPEFDPSSKHQTISAWLNKVDQLADMYGWNETEKIHYALAKLSGTAKTWCQAQATSLHKWSEWKKKLYETFRENYAELLSFMLSIRVKRGESLVNYYYEKMGLLSSCRIEGQDAVDCLLDGIDDDAVRLGAYAACLETPEQVIRYFQVVEVTYSPRREATRSNANRSKRRKPRCINCGMEGHRTFRCFQRKNKCSICYKRGHLDAFCWARADIY